MIQELIKAQNENVKAIVLEVFKEQETKRKGIAELAADSEFEGNKKKMHQGGTTKEVVPTPVSVISTKASGTDVPIHSSNCPPPAVPPFIAPPHQYPISYPYYPPYPYQQAPPPQGYSQHPPGNGAVYSVNFFHH